MTRGALSVSHAAQQEIGINLCPDENAYFLSFESDGGEYGEAEKIKRDFRRRAKSGHLPAAVILETIQAEGGVHVASTGWLRQLHALAKHYGVLTIVDDVQVGCGRTGPFFSFEPAGIKPDIVCLSKSISGYGLPLSVVLMKPVLDVWKPGEFTGTFRGHNLAFTTGAEAIRHYWSDDALARDVTRKTQILERNLSRICEEFQPHLQGFRGRGFIQGLTFREPSLAQAVSDEAFRCGLLVEALREPRNVLKILPPLVISDMDLKRGMDIVRTAVERVVRRRNFRSR